MSIAVSDVSPASPAVSAHLHRRAHKFGGSSLADAARYRHAAALLAGGASAATADAFPTASAVVVSAMQGVTDALVALAESAAMQQPWTDAWSQLRNRHLAVAEALDPQGEQGLAAWLQTQFAQLHAQLEGFDAGDAAAVHGLGEVWSARLLQTALGGETAGWARLDAREVLVVHPGELGVAVDWNRSRARLAEWKDTHAESNLVITGFIAADTHGRPTTLGRNGSDYSAAIFAVLLDAEDLTIWTDVDGVLSADPRLVPEAVCLETLSYAEACELAYFGARVLHPQTMAPAMQAGLPIRIRNTLDPDAPGTLITQRSVLAASPVKGLSLVERLALLELSGAGLIGVPGTAERMFAALREAGVSVTMISQGSSEHSICCVLREDQAERARLAVETAFLEAIGDGQVQRVTVTPGICVLAAVGDGMVGTIGVAGRLLGGLAQARVNARAIAQGAGERNISIAIHARDATRALRAAHAAFWLSPQTVSIGVIGPGQVGGALLAQLAAAEPRLREVRIDLRLRALANSRTMRFADRRLAPEAAAAQLADGEALDLDRFTAHVRAEHLPHALIVDCSGSDAVADRYADWLAAGIHVVTPNKRAGSGPWRRYQAIAQARHGGAQFRYEATVGAGLPVIHTLRGLLDTGDELAAVDGVLSGTLAWLFNRFDGSAPFSSLVQEAQQLGYTEPDPRDDLGGLDVARKLVILAREAGRTLSLDDVEVDNLVPEHLRTIPRDEFMKRLSELDAPMQARLQQAGGRPLRHLARLEHDGRASVSLIAPEPGHPSLHGRLTDNLIAFRTRRYADNPLVVQGPGAGPEVTAAGVFADMLAVAQSLGARL